MTTTSRSPVTLLEELKNALTARGLTVTVDQRLWAVNVQNPAAADLKQVVRLGGRDGEPYWFWEWSGPGRTDPPEYEPMCRAHAVAEATERVTRVLAVAAAED